MYRVLLLFLFISTNCFSQTKYDLFDVHIKKADSLKKVKEYKLGLAQYQIALNILKPRKGGAFGGQTGVDAYFDLGVCALYTGNEDLANEWMRKAISIGGLQKVYLEVFDGFPDIQQKTFYKQIIKDYNKLRLEFFSSLKDIDAYLQLQILVERDQFVRKIDNYLDGVDEKYMVNINQKYIESKKNNDTINSKKYLKLIKKIRNLPHERNVEYLEFKRKLMRNVDSLNVKSLIRLTEKHGWHNEASILLWHWRGVFGTDHYVWNHFMPILKKEIKENNLHSSYLRSLELQKARMEKFRKNKNK